MAEGHRAVDRVRNAVGAEHLLEERRVATRGAEHERHVSRRHAVIWRDSDGNFLVRHLGERSATLVNGRQILRDVPVTLGPNDTVTVGDVELRMVEEEAAKLGNPRYLVQGTLYSDVIESGGGHGAATIKSHHNVGGLPEDMAMELVEPLRLLFKDEVRRVGEELGLPERMVWRQPFPGPGLAIRIIGEVTAGRLDTLRRADAIAREELTVAGLDNQIWQCPVVLLADIRSVGVQGDGRTYGHPIVLRPVSSEDAMTADWTRVPYEVLERISTRITNEVPEVNQVALDVTSKPPGTIEWE